MLRHNWKTPPKIKAWLGTEIKHDFFDKMCIIFTMLSFSSKAYLFFFFFTTPSKNNIKMEQLFFSLFSSMLPDEI